MKAVHTVIVAPPKVFFTLIGHFLVSVDNNIIIIRTLFIEGDT